MESWEPALLQYIRYQFSLLSNVAFSLLTGILPLDINVNTVLISRDIVVVCQLVLGGKVK